MRVVCDTNVLVSGILFGGNPRELLRLCSSGTLTNFTSPELLREIEQVLLRPKFGLNEEQVYGIIRLFRDTFSLVMPEIRICIITADPDDNRVLETASSARAEAIISGDAHLLELKEWNGIVIVTPADFLKNFFVG
ncbi:MAG: putative toxin-antitoxin system toxin component, PIN family [Chlorobiaceae bacterium]|nr:putative toxin-antitoxin system toxin component, PIN family [Chlorobiaceae bacterium]